MENQPSPSHALHSPTPSAAKPYPGLESTTPRGNGRGWILALAILQAVGALLMFAITQRTAEPMVAKITLVITLGLSVIFFGLWIWGKKAPVAALLTALIIFLTIHLLDAVFEPANLFKGIFLKIVLITGLCTALKKAYTKKREAELEASEPHV